MKKETYAFLPELKKYAHMRVPLFRPLLPPARAILHAVYLTRRSGKNISLTKIKIPAAYAEDGRKKPLSAAVYMPKGAKGPLPCVLFFHGGGFVFGAAPHHYAMAKAFVEGAGCVVMLLDYRLAPKFPFPAALYDALSAYKWLIKNGAALKIDAARICLAGDSAGGCLAAALCLLAKDKGLPLPKAQLLLYPVTDRRMNSQSMRQFTDTPMCNSKDIAKYYSFYGECGEEKEYYLSPALAPSLKGMPAAYIEVAEYDCLRDEGIAYAKALKEAGVEVSLTKVEDAMHGYDIACRAPFTKELNEARTEFIKRHLF